MGYQIPALPRRKLPRLGEKPFDGLEQLCGKCGTRLLLGHAVHKLDGEVTAKLTCPNKSPFFSDHTEREIVSTDGGATWSFDCTICI